MQNMFRPLLLGLCLVAAASAASLARGAESGPVSVKVNMARVLRVNTPAATVIIGNPAIADVTIQDPQTLVLTGKTFGQTNLIVLDSLGEPIADTVVEVLQAQDDNVTIFAANARMTVSCSPACAPAMMIGDDPLYTASIRETLDEIKEAQK